MLSSPPHHCMRYLISHSPSAEDFPELFDCPSYTSSNFAVLTVFFFGERKNEVSHCVVWRYHCTGLCPSIGVGDQVLKLYRTLDLWDESYVLYELLASSWMLLDICLWIWGSSVSTPLIMLWKNLCYCVSQVGGPGAKCMTSLFVNTL